MVQPKGFAISVVILAAASITILELYKQEFKSISTRSHRSNLFTNLKSDETSLYNKYRSSPELPTRYDDTSDAKNQIKDRENELLHNDETDMLKKNSTPKMSVLDNKWKKNYIKVGVLIPSTTRKISKPSFKSFSLTSICIPSLLKTLEQNYSYTIYVGINDDDSFLTNNSQKLENMYPNVSLKVVAINANTFTATCNGIALRAYRDGMDYILRINDDTMFKSKNWTTIGINKLRAYNPPNIGVVGPKSLTEKQEFLTHDMVHRTHLVIFGYYYPPQFDNWWSDDWITRVYEPDRSTKLMKWVVAHQFTHGTRYKVNLKKKNLLSGLIKHGKDRLNKFIKKERNTDMRDE